MTIFIAWSGMASLSLARILRDWIPAVLKDVQVDTTVWVSSEDIAKGTLWFDELRDPLTSCEYCVLCITKSNVSAPWLLFEAGAMFSTLASISTNES
jgi:hypothetical protein